MDYYYYYYYYNSVDPIHFCVLFISFNSYYVETTPPSVFNCRSPYAKSHSHCISFLIVLVCARFIVNFILKTSEFAQKWLGVPASLASPAGHTTSIYSDNFSISTFSQS